MPKKALIIGVSGQDGGYLARHLIGLGYAVVGTTREAAFPANLVRLGLAGRVQVVALQPQSAPDVEALVEAVKPDELYMLSGQTSVGRSFADPAGTFESNAVATVAVLEAIRKHPAVRGFFAGSSECFGDTEAPANTRTPFAPVSPYGTTKAFAFWQVAAYRSVYGLGVASGVLFSHESPLRREGFVTPRIISAAVRIAGGSGERLRLGALYPIRDWGWAPEFVEAMHRVLQGDHLDDVVIATGRSVSLEYFVARAFLEVGLDWRDHVDVVAEWQRQADIVRSLADVSETTEALGWSATMDVDAVVARLVDCEKRGDPG